MRYPPPLVPLIAIASYNKLNPVRFLAVGHPDSNFERNAGRSDVKAAQDFGEKDGPCFDVGA